MPRVALCLRSPAAMSARAKQIRRQFDLGRQATLTRLDVELPPADGNWRIGAIVGPSGSGKSQLLLAAFGRPRPAPAWPANLPLIDALPTATTNDAAAILSAVGLNTIPAWLRPFHLLSAGEQFRANLARAILTADSRPLVIDEFTSCLDRATAKSACHALQKHLRASLPSPSLQPQPIPRLVVAGCHDDILPWLAPDWILRLPDGLLDWRSLRQRRPRLAATVHRAPLAAWAGFAPHHYLTAGIHPASRLYVLAVAGEPAACCATLANLGRRNWRRITRLVTLPAWQGLGLGLALAEEVATIESQPRARSPKPCISLVTSHPALIARMNRSPCWRPLWARNGRHEHHLSDHAVAGGGNRRRVSYLFCAKAT